MARTRTGNQKKKNNGANVGYEAEPWQMVDALRGSMDARGVGASQAAAHSGEYHSRQHLTRIASGREWWRYLYNDSKIRSA